MNVLLLFLKLITLSFLVAPIGAACGISDQQVVSNKELIMKTAGVIEIVIYATKEGVIESDHIKKAARITQLLANFDGFVSRHFTREANGKWIDLVYWQDMSSAMNAADTFTTLPESQEYLADIDEKDIQFMHTTILNEMSSK